MYSLISLLVWLSTSLLSHVTAKVDQCHIDCNAPISVRPVGPTRPWHSKDDLGNTLKLTKPYPFSIAGSAVGVLEFNFTMNIDDVMRLNFTTMKPQPFKDYIEMEKNVFADIISGTLSKQYKSYDLEVVEFPKLNTLESLTKSDKFECVTMIQINADHNGFNFSTASIFFSSHLKPTLLQNIDNITYNELLSGYGGDMHPTLNRTFLLEEYTRHMVKDTFSVEYPNPYTEFCELGCSIFFSLPTSNGRRVELSQCTSQCDETYKYNISVGYNDLAEVARLECRDGCQMALRRCQPGYFCSQVNVTNKKKEVNHEIKYKGGYMHHCPAGTYRDVDYSSVEQCVPCPPGRFREAIKGHSLESCSKCPPRTFNAMNGSVSILDCLRCPAGTFTNEPGSAFCLCITPDACAEDQLPSPADAEKRNTIPYIGRW